MAGPKKTMRRILAESSDASIRFDDLRTLLRHMGFSERIKGSHHIFKLAGVRGRLVLPRSGPEAKAYQVRQVRELIRTHGLYLEES